VNFDPTMIMLSLIPSGVGVFLFMYGKKTERFLYIASGIILMVYPYFVNTVLQMFVGGAAIAAVFWLALQQGW
jgi:hypothetical protein